MNKPQDEEHRQRITANREAARIARLANLGSQASGAPALNHQQRHDIMTSTRDDLLAAPDKLRGLLDGTAPTEGRTPGK